MAKKYRTAFRSILVYCETMLGVPQNSDNLNIFFKIEKKNLIFYNLSFTTNKKFANSNTSKVS